MKCGSFGYLYVGAVAAVMQFSFSALADNAANSSLPIHYTAEQAEVGGKLYQQYCAACHGPNLDDGSFAAPVVGDVFYGKWGGKPVLELFKFIKERMPPGLQGDISDEQYRQIVSYLLQKQGLPASDEPLSDKGQVLGMMALPLPASGLVEAEPIDIPPHPNPAANPLDHITPVTDAMLQSPPADDWLMWRRTYDSKGFTPLGQITKTNVKGLRLAWAAALPKGRNITTPVVHDGVMFAYAFGDVVQALDAKTGELLWVYDKRPTSFSVRYSYRGFALYDDMVIFATDDGNVVALDMKTGAVKWDADILEAQPYRFAGGPIVADGKVILGTSTGRSPGHNFVVGLDAHTGAELWRFHSVAREGEAGSETWNNLPDEERAGAGMWSVGSYDPENKLFLIGTGNTYNAGPMRSLAEGAKSNDGLYMDSTLALDVKSGKLAWHFQHLPNDQWNYDWTFERTIFEKPGVGKVMAAAGKIGIFDLLKVKDGSYVGSVDMGQQTVVDYIDPKTGKKHIAEGQYPDPEKEVFVCPSMGGARNWMPTAYNQGRQIMYVPYWENCMKAHAPRAGDYLLGGLGYATVPRPGSDGKYGGVQAIDMKTGETVWQVRRRNMPGTGVLATATDLVFAGYFDRTFAAYDAGSGEELWQTRLSGQPSGGPISYQVDGKQYIAVVTGWGWAHTAYTPELALPKDAVPEIWVFELP